MPLMPKPLTPDEKAYFDTIKQVATSARPRDLILMRLTLDGRDVAVVAQRLIDAETAEEVGFMPLALILDEETTKRLRDPSGKPPIAMRPDGLEGAA